VSKKYSKIKTVEHLNLEKKEAANRIFRSFLLALIPGTES